MNRSIHTATRQTVPTVDSLKREVIPNLFANPSQMGSYAASSEESNALNEFSRLMEQGSVSELSSAIEAIVEMLAHADPRKISQTEKSWKGWLDSFMGRDVEKQIRYEQARTSLDNMLKSTASIAEGVYDTLTAIDKLISQHQQEVATLSVHIQAAREYLAELPTTPATSASENDVTQFDRPKERFARKVANLAALEASHQMSLMQLKLTQAQAIDMLDRFNETTRVLVPVWRQHTMVLLSSSKMSPEMMAQANTAHEALMKSLSTSLAESHK